MDDSIGFIRRTDRVVLDEIQRHPDLLRAIKLSVDSDRRPGRFLLTGSANVLALPQLSESLAGRLAVIELLPLSPSEILGCPPTFLESALTGTVAEPKSTLVGSELVDLVLAGGFPEMVRRTDWQVHRRRRLTRHPHRERVRPRHVRLRVHRTPHRHRVHLQRAHHSLWGVSSTGTR